MKFWKSAIVILLFTLLVCGAWPQNQPPPASSNTASSNTKTVDNLGLEVQDQNNDQSKDQSSDQNRDQQTVPSQTPAGEGARATQATPETTVSPKEAKELFRSVDEILQFASQDTDCPSSTR
jgi:hypothetical protein